MLGWRSSLALAIAIDGLATACAENRQQQKSLQVKPRLDSASARVYLDRLPADKAELLRSVSQALPHGLCPLLKSKRIPEWKAHLDDVSSQVYFEKESADQVDLFQTLSQVPRVLLPTLAVALAGSSEVRETLAHLLGCSRTQPSATEQERVEKEEAASTRGALRGRSEGSASERGPTLQWVAGLAAASLLVMMQRLATGRGAGRASPSVPSVPCAVKKSVVVKSPSASTLVTPRTATTVTPRTASHTPRSELEDDDEPEDLRLLKEVSRKVQSQMEGRGSETDSDSFVWSEEGDGAERYRIYTAACTPAGSRQTSKSSGASMRRDWPTCLSSCGLLCDGALIPRSSSNGLPPLRFHIATADNTPAITPAQSTCPSDWHYRSD
eukprot:gb/GFBE01023902.1/.p1 GENE.gb/GFBE01023902.1/~~gb/GFBE01023902.1/.p1  ORF type:complete len:383 (+),score=45.38 gb/GFBE01023902.1/:1-1149(+)